MADTTSCLVSVADTISCVISVADTISCVVSVADTISCLVSAADTISCLVSAACTCCSEQAGPRNQDLSTHTSPETYMIHDLFISYRPHREHTFMFQITQTIDYNYTFVTEYPENIHIHICNIAEHREYTLVCSRPCTKHKQTTKITHIYL